MLTTFTSEAHSDITMLSEVAEQLLKMLNKSVATGVILASEMPKAIVDLKRGSAAAVAPRNDPDDDSVVTLSQRAFPLIEMLEASEKENCRVTWETN